MEILIILLAFLFGGCAAPNGENIGNMENVTFTLPAWPPECSDSELEKQYPPLDHWEIEIVRGNKFANGERFALSPSERVFSRQMPRNKTVAIIAHPVTKNSKSEQTVFFHPAGTVYPNLSNWNGIECTNSLSWEDGFTAKVVYTIYSSAENDGYDEDTITDFVSRFNWKKFSETIYSREQKSFDSFFESENSVDSNTKTPVKFYNPWQIDMKTLVQKLLSKKFTVTAMNPKEIISIPIPIDSINFNFIEELCLSPYIPENRFIAVSNNLTVSTATTNRFLCSTDCMVLINTPNRKKVSTEVVFLPKILKEEY